MDPVRADNNAATIGRSIGGSDVYTPFDEIYASDRLVQQYPVLVLDMVVQNLQQLLAIKEMQTITKPIEAVRMEGIMCHADTHSPAL
jgi:hypothetical protein